MELCVEPEAQASGQGQSRLGVQPSGFLLGLSSDWRVDCASANLEQFTGIEVESVIGKPISSFLTPEAVHLIRNRVALLRDDESPERLIDQQLTPGGRNFDAALRQARGQIILEAVPGADPGGIDIAGTVQRMLTRLENSCVVEDLAATATRELRGLMGFDAIQIYRNGVGAPDCIASFVRSGLAGLEPAKLRTSALERPLWLADTGAKSVPILCARGDRPTSAPSFLAPPDPILADEIRRAGGHCAMLLPIKGSGTPWGFGLALHRSARAPRLARLSAAELFAHVLGYRLQAAESGETNR